jgi:pimeloyl-ACP methyl ester carboxylesterase
MTYAMTPDGTRIAYQLQGQGAPLVLLAGQANNHHWWDAVRADFHPAGSTLTLDCHCHGRSRGGSDVQGAPGGAGTVPADLPEDRIGEVNAKADRVRLFQLGNEMMTMLGGLGTVMVVEAGPFGVVHLDR